MQPFAIHTGDASDGAPTKHEIALGAKLANIVEGRKALSGNLAAHGYLKTETGYLKAYNIGGVTKVIAIRNKPPAYHDEEGDEDDPHVHLSVPLMYSGQVLHGICAPGEGLTVEISTQTQRRLAGYNDDKISSETRITTGKFEVPYNNIHDEFLPEQSYDMVWTQYRDLYPTWFSGLMGKVVQIVAGYGKQNTNKKNNLFIPDSVKAAIELEIGKFKPHGCLGRPPKDGKIQFDYKFFTGNGVLFGDDKTPWLVWLSEIYGALAMPLPMIPASQTKAFRDYIEKVNDTEILEILDLFGGMPSGEGFPDNWTDWERAGVVTRLCDMGEFYQWLPFAGTTLGWSFSETGNEAVNSGYNYGPTTMQQAAVFSMRFKLGAITASSAKVDLPEGAELYFSEVLPKLYGNSGRAAKYKIGRMPGELAARIEPYVQAALQGGQNPAAEAAYWDEATAPPIASCSATLVKTSEGRVWGWGGPFKLPMTLGKDRSCYSHDFSPHPDPKKEFTDAEKTFDTVVYAYFVGDDLKHIHFTYDPRKVPSSRTPITEEDVRLIANKTTEWGEGDAEVWGNFYTSDFDAREWKTPSYFKETRKAWHKKVFPYYGQIPGSWPDGGLVRFHDFRERVVTEVTEGFNKKVGVCVPFYTRDGCAHGSHSHKLKSYTTTTWAGTLLSDPYSYRIFATGDHFWIGAISLDTFGVPKLWDDYTVQVYQQFYNPAAGSAKGFIMEWPSELDQGPWANVGENVTDIYYANNTGPASHDVALWVDMQPGFESTFDPNQIVSSGDFELSYAPTIAKLPEPASDTFYAATPYVFAGVTLTYMFTGHKNLMGTKVFARGSEPGNTVVVGATRFNTEDSRHYFIGVINE
jgi:hypothetical protein